MLPGGQQLLFTLAKGSAVDRWEHAQVVVQSLTTGQRKVIVENGSDGHYLPTGHLLFARGGVLYASAFDLGQLETRGSAVPVVEGVRRAVAGPGVQGNPLLSGEAQYSVSDAGTLVYMPGPVAPLSQTTDIAWVSRDGKVERLMMPPGLYNHIRVSPDGRRIVFASHSGQTSNVYTYTPSGTESMQRLTFNGNSRFPIWTSDGKRVAFQSDREGDGGIYWQPADGSGTAERLTKAEAGTTHMPESWSPAGDVMLYAVIQGPRITLWSYSVRDKQSARFDDVSGAAPIGAAFSPDGRWVAYTADLTVYVQPWPPTGAKYQVPGGQGPHHPFWSRDGKELFYEPTIAQLFVVPVRTGAGFAFGNPTPLAAGAFGSTNPAFARNRDVDISGQRFITYVSADQNLAGETLPNELQVVLNWFDELKARVPTTK
jgi:serine/threonine-protein kinase